MITNLRAFDDFYWCKTFTLQAYIQITESVHAVWENNPYQYESCSAVPKKAESRNFLLMHDELSYG